MPVWEIAGAAMMLLAVSATAVAWARKRPYLLVGWFWYLGMLVPVIGFVQVGAQGRADRYTYLPQIGLSIAVVWLLKSFWRREGILVPRSAWNELAQRRGISVHRRGARG